MLSFVLKMNLLGLMAMSAQEDMEKLDSLLDLDGELMREFLYLSFQEMKSIGLGEEHETNKDKLPSLQLIDNNRDGDRNSYLPKLWTGL